MASSTYERWKQHKVIMDSFETRMQKLDNKQRKLLTRVDEIKERRAQLEKEFMEEAHSFSSTLVNTASEHNQPIIRKKDSRVQSSDKANNEAAFDDFTDASDVAQQNESPDDTDDLTSEGSIEVITPGITNGSTSVPAGTQTNRSMSTQTSGLRPLMRIAGTEPTIVRSWDNKSWIELRCPVCGCNAKQDGDELFQNIVSFGSHIRQAHKGELPEGMSYHTEGLVKFCTFHTLTDFEAESILRGDLDAYSVPFLYRNNTKRSSEVSSGLANGQEAYSIKSRRIHDTDPKSKVPRHSGPRKSAPAGSAYGESTGSEVDNDDWEMLPYLRPNRGTQISRIRNTVGSFREAW